MIKDDAKFVLNQENAIKHKVVYSKTPYKTVNQIINFPSVADYTKAFRQVLYSAILLLKNLPAVIYQ